MNWVTNELNAVNLTKITNLRQAILKKHYIAYPKIDLYKKYRRRPGLAYSTNKIINRPILKVINVE